MDKKENNPKENNVLQPIETSQLAVTHNIEVNDTPQNLEIPGNKSISNIIDEYLTSFTNENTKRTYRCYLMHYCNMLHIESLKSFTLSYYKLYSQTTNFIQSYSSDNTKRIIISCLRDFYNYLQEMFLFPKMPIPHIRLKPRQSKSKTLSATAREITKLLKKLDKNKLFSKKDHLKYCLVLTLATTGLRISECLQITKDMVHSGVLQIVQKQGRLRSLSLPDKTKQILMEFIELYPCNSSFVFTTESNHVLLRQNAYKYIHEITKKKYGCHSFRKSVIEILLKQNYHTHEVAKVSGHSSINMVFYYDTRDYDTTIHNTLVDIYDDKQHS